MCRPSEPADDSMNDHTIRLNREGANHETHSCDFLSLPGNE
jgi:hypothetical protein